MSVNDLFNQDLKVVNLGLKSFHNDLKYPGNNSSSCKLEAKSRWQEEYAQIC